MLVTVLAIKKINNMKDFLIIILAFLCYFIWEQNRVLPWGVIVKVEEARYNNTACYYEIKYPIWLVRNSRLLSNKGLYTVGDTLYFTKKTQ